ncbi:MAG: capsule assembly Wzi family protein, partial [Thermodesulfobacteriota bacterium]
DLGNWVAYRSAPLSMALGQVSLARSSETKIEWNEGGIPTPDGLSAELSALGRFEPYPWLSVDGRAATWFGERDANGTQYGEASVGIGHRYASLQAGRITSWYGPGRRGALIFTNNAQPFRGVRLHNPVPISFTGFLSFLGTAQYDLFFARLDAARPLPKTLLSGLRLGLRPSRYFEIGASRAIHFGGEGQGESVGDWWKAFIGSEIDNLDFRTNQLVAFDGTLTLPFKTQPVQLYFEWGAEDQARGGYKVPRFAKWATLSGVFFPSILGNPDFDFRVEYADNHMGGHGSDWYTHLDSPHVYKGRFLGHPMGTDARDLSFQGRYFLLPSTFLELTVNRMDRFLAAAPTEETIGFRLAFIGWLTPSLRAGAGFHAERVANAGMAAGARENGFAAWADLAWRFSGGYAYHSSKERP